MRLDDLRVSMLRECLSIYAQHAYPKDGMGKMPALEFSDETRPGACLSFFTEEKKVDGSQCGRRFTVRLGNWRYAFMKLVLQEHLIQDEFFLSVDTHDDSFRDEGPEAEEIRALKSFNLELKGQIERALYDANLPTCLHLKGLVESMLVEREPSKNRRILLVDDEMDIADTLELLLTARGYDVDRAAHGLEALEKVDPTRHDLILMDNEMPYLHGIKACEILKSKPETKEIPILLATAGCIDMSEIRRADAFLAKPFHAEILFSFIQHLIPDTQNPDIEESESQKPDKQEPDTPKPDDLG